MNPLLRALSRSAALGGSPPPPSGVTAVSKAVGHSNMLTQTVWYQDPNAFMNYMHSTYEPWSDASGGLGFYNRYTPASCVVANGWLVNVPVGASVKQGFFADPRLFPLGDWVITSASGMTCQIYSQTGMTNVVQGTVGSPNCTFTVTGQCAFGINLINQTGAVIASMNDLYVGLVSNRTAYLQGEIFDPSYMARLSSPAMIRFNDWQNINAGWDGSIDPADLPTEANMIWGGDTSYGNPYKYCGMPLSVVAKFAKKMNCVLWFCVPLGNKQTYGYTVSGNVISTFYRSQYETGLPLAPHHISNGQTVYFSFNTPAGLTKQVRYFVRDATSTTFKVAATLGGAALTVADQGPSYNILHGIDNNLDPRPFYAEVVRQLYAEWPEANVLGEIGNESWNPTYEWDYIVDAGWAVTQKYSANGGVVLDTGDFPKNGACALAWYQTELWRAIEAKYPRNQNIRAITFQTGSTTLAAYKDWVSTDYEAGSIFGNMLDGIFTAPYFYPQMTKPQEYAAGAIGWTNAQWLKYWQSSLFAEIDAVQVHQAVTKFKPNGQPLAQLCYESSYQDIGYNETLTGQQASDLLDARRAFFRTDAAGPLGAEYIQRVFKDQGYQESTIWHAFGWFGNAYAWGMNEFGGASTNNAFHDGVVSAWQVPTLVPVAPVIVVGSVGSTTQVISVPYSVRSVTYRVERRTTAGPGAWTTAAGSFTKDDFNCTGIAPSTSYDYSAFGINEVGDSVRSNIVTQVSDPAQAVLFSDNFNAADGAVTGYTFTGGSLWERAGGQLHKANASPGACLVTASAAKYIQINEGAISYYQKIFFRYLDDNNYWVLQVSDNVRRARFGKVVAGTYTEVPVSPSPLYSVDGANDNSRTAPQLWRIEWKDSTKNIVVKRNGVILFNYTETNSDLQNGGTMHGVWSESGGGIYDDCVWDNLEIGG